MPDASIFDPYSDIQLCHQLGPILSRKAALDALIELPPIPKSMQEIEPHLRLRHLMRLRDFHLPSEMEGRLFESIDLMVREGYRYRDPALPATMAVISGEALRRKRPGMPALAAASSGISGSGKTEAALRCLGCYPMQVILHESFPGFKGPHPQVVWLSIDVPPSGKAEDLARALMVAWDRATGQARFKTLLAKDRFANPMAALDEWRQVAATHFLGILHLDEVQNFFKLSTLEQRRKRKMGEGPPELSIVEDQCLRWILTLLNTWGIPVLFTGTPDGIGALSKRLSTLERFATGGFHEFNPFGGPKEPAFRNIFLGSLGRYQYTKGRLKVTDGVAELIDNQSAGVPRIVIALWMAANRLALEKPTDTLTVEDFTAASDTFLRPLQPAIAALRSGDAARCSRYEDLVSRDSTFWPSFWESMARL